MCPYLGETNQILVLSRREFSLLFRVAIIFFLVGYGFSLEKTGPDEGKTAFSLTRGKNYSPQHRKSGCGQKNGCGKKRKNFGKSSGEKDNH